MKSVFKYILFAIVLFLISGISMQEDIFIHKENTAHTTEYSQYLHTQFEPQQDICFATHQISSAQCSARLVKKNKRSVTTGKSNWATLKSGKHNLSYLALNLSYNKSVSNTSAAEPASQFIRFCRLLI